MSKEIKMPQLSDTMSSGKILKWNKNVGDEIKRGDILAEVETDKANLEIESFDAGTLLAIKTPANETAKVGEVIAVIGQAGEVVSGSPTPSSNTESTSASSTQSQPTPTASNTSQESSPSQSYTANDYASDSKRVVASPLAKKLAAQGNIDLNKVKGSGPNGRIVKKDVLSGDSVTVATTSTPATAATTETKVFQETNRQVEASAATSSPSSTPLSKMRQTIALRMQQAVTEIPHFYTTTSINMSQAQALRAICKNNPDLKNISINHMIIKAAAYALATVPRVNCSYRDGALYNPAAINIGIVTAVEDGLLIPVIKETNQLNLKDVAFEAKSAIDRARAGRPSSSDLSGGTFSISNMGMFDVENFTAIISPGQGAILAVSSTIDTPVVSNNTVVIAPMMKVTLSVDHRIIDGTVSSTFLKAFKEALEQPAIMLI